MGVPPVLIHFSGWDFPGSWLGSSYLRCLEDTHGLRIKHPEIWWKKGDRKDGDATRVYQMKHRMVKLRRCFWGLHFFKLQFNLYICYNYIYINRYIYIYKYIYIHTCLSPHISLQVKLSAENQTPSDKKESISWLGVTMAIFFTHKLGLYLKFIVCNHLGLFFPSMKNHWPFFHILF
jgi:hypothetical protein